MTAVAVFGGLVMAGAAVLQSTFLRFVEIAGVAPDLVLIVLVFLANKNGSMPGQTAGFAAGVVLDVMGLAPLGFYALIYTVLGALFGISRGKMFVDPIFIPVLLAVVAMVIKAVLALLIGAFFSLDGPSGQIFTSGYLIEIAYTGLVAPMLFGVLGAAPWLQPDRRRGGTA
jgi:rod shape-determining protein MreD